MKRSVLFAAFGMVLVGCAGYRVVKRNQTGGVVTLYGPREEAMQKATAAMQAHCGGAYTITEEGEAVVGTESTSAGRADNTRTGVAASSSTETHDKTEWRVTYVCGVQAPAAATPVAPPPTTPTPTGTN